MSTGHFGGVRAVSIPVADQARALRVLREQLGFEKLRDVPTPDGGRWIELSPGGGTTWSPWNPRPRAPPGARSASGSPPPDAAAAHAALRAAGVDTDEILSWPGVPPMFAFRDPDGNAFSLTETG